MLPGFVSGFYGFDDCHVDLARLAQYARSTLVLATATGLDLQARLLAPSEGSTKPCRHPSEARLNYASGACSMLSNSRSRSWVLGVVSQDDALSTTVCMHAWQRGRPRGMT